MAVLDASVYQGKIDWDSVIEYGVAGGTAFEAAYIRLSQWRLSEGGNAPDARAEENILALQERRFPVGGYQRANPWANSPDTECAIFLDRLASNFLAPYPGEDIYTDALIPAIDLEPTDDATRDATVDWPRWIRGFFEVWEKRTGGARILYYSSGSNFEGRYGGVLDLPWWVSLWVADAAAFNHSPTAGGQTKYTFSGRTLLHQHSARGTVAGITGHVDLNATMPYTNLNRLRALPLQ